MIRYVHGDIFDSKASCLVNPVNCVGVMGKGLALQFRRRYPEMYEWYREQCANHMIQPGQVAFWASKKRPNPVICLFPTKNHWREPSTVQMIDEGLAAFVKYAPEMKVTSCAFPMLGCGLGGLDFARHVRPLIETHLSVTDFDTEVYVSNS